MKTRRRAGWRATANAVIPNAASKFESSIAQNFVRAKIRLAKTNPNSRKHGVKNGGVGIVSQADLARWAYNQQRGVKGAFTDRMGDISEPTSDAFASVNMNPKAKKLRFQCEGTSL